MIAKRYATTFLLWVSAVLPLPFLQDKEETMLAWLRKDPHVTCTLWENHGLDVLKRMHAR